MARTEPKYRTFDELLDSVRIDLYTWDLEGLIGPQQLIKVAIRVNYDLGLRINQSRSKAIEIHKGKGKLPEDFYVMNFGLVCEEHHSEDIPSYNKTYTEGILEGVSLAESFLADKFVNQSTTILDILSGQNIINHQLHTQNIIVQAFDESGIALDFDINVTDSENITIYSTSLVTIKNVKVIIMGAKISTMGTGSGSCPALLDCAADGTPRVHYVTNGRRNRSNSLIPLRMQRSKSVSDDCFNLNTRGRYDASLKNGFIHTNFDEGVIYINYQSLMEDDDGNLLVLDHPYCNEYYEYAIKQRIYENLFMSGESVSNHLQLMEQKLRGARANALSFVNTPDFAEMKRTWEMNRKAQYHNYYNMFKSYIY